ncbi:alpha/beta fold hydrolase [Mycolicibacterium sp. HK-90]|uniref:alpha/beta fold hydrolase n=1 Tax=Mycolicibacterium sp. HK-90 TaxID=3056937 RepID=UPI00265A88B4|nr:alpha/beta fold hydrolase [Mycolicibacterium sp. HK-90]WKG04680.1 alpha/beta fold hydrolase [Mycolicibacterium sp. HK-90]
MTKPGWAIRAFMATGWGVLVIALWMGLIAGAGSTAHADPGREKSTTQSDNDSGTPATQRDTSTRLGPRKQKPRRVDAATVRERPRLSVAKSSPRPSPESSAKPPGVRDLVDGIANRARVALTDVVDRTPITPAARSLPRPKDSAKRDVPQPPEVADVAAADEAAPDIADAIDTITHPVGETAPLAQVNTVVDRIATQSRAALTDLTDRVSKAPADQPATQPIARLAAATVSTPLAAPRPAPLVNIVGSLVFNVVGAALQVFSGPPVLPPGSNVTVRSSTLDMPGTNQTVRADWYFPEDLDSATGVIYLQHGFMATGPMYSYTAAYLAESTNSIVVAPTLSSNLFDPNAEWIGGEPMQQSVADLFADDRSELTASASAAAGHPVTLPSKFVLVGHSLGGMLVTGAAGRMVDNGAVDDLAGVVLLDAVDTHRDMPDALDQLTGANYRPVLLISSERYVWNLHGTVGDELQAARPGEFNGVMLVGGRHIDGLQGANPILQFAEYLIAGFSQPENVDAVTTISAGWINDMLNGTDTGVYGAPQESIEIPTSSGTATAVVLPFASDESVQATPWDGLAEAILNALFPYAVYEPLAGQSVAMRI